MNAEPLTRGGSVAVQRAIGAAKRYREAEAELARAVQIARDRDVPILYLADALGVSRSRIRVLARDSER